MTPLDTTIDYKVSSFLYIDFSALFLIDSLLVQRGNKFLLKKLFEIPFDDTQVSKSLYDFQEWYGVLDIFNISIETK